MGPPGENSDITENDVASEFARNEPRERSTVFSDIPFQFGIEIYKSANREP